MESIPSEFPISLQSWLTKEKDPNAALPEMIRRINIERGGFRDLSEDGLRQEIAEAEAGAGGGASSDEEEAEKPDRLKELVTARDEMVHQLEQAHQSALFALEFVSLLLSKDQPNQGGLTLSPFLRETVGMGTLGADRLSKQPDAKAAAKTKDGRAIAKGWKILNLNKSVDSILASATRLEKEIEVETKYWEQVLAISDKGWSICRLPQERHTLGVRFGFSESATEFKQRSLAALRREKDGSLSLDEGIGRLEPQALRVRIRHQGQETGSSPIPSPLPDDAPIESLILQARNTTFFSELWQEVNREARSVASFGVRSKDNTITCPLSPTKTIVLDLVPLSSTSHPLTGSDDQIATGIALALQLLLSHQHRQNRRRRSQIPPPTTSQKRLNPPYNLLRPLLTRLAHQRCLSNIHALLSPLISLLRSAGLSPTYTVTATPPPTLPLSASEATIHGLINNLESTTIFNITDSVTITLLSRTAMFPVSGTLYSLSLNEECPLSATCKPPSSLDAWGKVVDWIFFATGCAMASWVSSLPPLDLDAGPNLLPSSKRAGESPASGSEEAGGAEREGDWKSTIQPFILRKHFASISRSKQMSFSLAHVGDTGSVKARVKWEWAGEKLELHERKGEGSYEWVGRVGEGDWDEGEGEVVRELRDVVREAGM